MDKKVVKVDAIGAICIALCMIIVVYVSYLRSASVSHDPSVYPMCGEVISIDNKRDMFCVKTYGYTYEVNGVEDYCIGDMVAMILDDKGTQSIEDDVVIDTRYCVI